MSPTQHKSYKLPLLLLVLFITPYLVQATHPQVIFPVQSEEYTIITYLYAEAGFAHPSQSGPWTTAELLHMLKELTPHKLSPNSRRLYLSLEKELSSVTENPDTVTFDILSLSICPETYLHTSTPGDDYFSNEDDWYTGYEQRNPFVKAEVETGLGNAFFAHTELSIGLNRSRGSIEENAPSFDDRTNERYDHPVSFNIPYLWPKENATPNDVSMNFPYRAYVSFGASNWYIQIGRDRIKWGSGESGSLLIGDHLLYHDFLRYSYIGTNWKFSTAALFFPHPITYGYTSEPSPDPTYLSQHDAIKGLRLFLTHRIELTPASWISLAVTESIMYMSEDGIIIPSYLNPMNIFHNYFIRGNANSLLNLELELVPVPGLSIYAHGVIDELPAPVEGGGSSWNNPSGYGILGGMRISRPVTKGFVYGSVEGAYTTPYLYLRDNGLLVDAAMIEGNALTANQTSGQYGNNFIVGIREFSPSNVGGTSQHISIIEDFLGYQYGNDAIVFQTKIGIFKPKKSTLEMTALGMIHGTHDMYTFWIRGEDAVSATTPTSSPVSDNQIEENDDRDAISYTLQLSFSWDITLDKDLSLYGNIADINCWNYNNFSSNPYVQDLQCMLGVNIALL